MKIVKILLVALALVTAVPGIGMAFAAEPNPVEAASGVGVYTPEDRTAARVEVCFAALKAGIGPDALRAAMKAKGFDEDAQARTLEVCSVFVTGIAVGEQLAASEPTVRT